jgi:hypothetical protein
LKASVQRGRPAPCAADLCSRWSKGAIGDWEKRNHMSCG